MKHTDEFARISRRCRKTEPSMPGDPAEREAWKRRVSLRITAELRARGLLLPENEGYAPGSWAAK